LAYTELSFKCVTELKTDECSIRGYNAEKSIYKHEMYLTDLTLLDLRITWMLPDMEGFHVPGLRR
jgi:hypothetical protein